MGEFERSTVCLEVFNRPYANLSPLKQPKVEPKTEESR